MPTQCYPLPGKESKHPTKRTGFKPENLRLKTVLAGRRYVTSQKGHHIFSVFFVNPKHPNTS